MGRGGIREISGKAFNIFAYIRRGAAQTAFTVVYVLAEPFKEGVALSVVEPKKVLAGYADPRPMQGSKDPAA